MKYISAMMHDLQYRSFTCSKGRYGAFSSKIKAPEFPGMDLKVLKSYLEVNEQAGGLFPVQSCACGINQE